jgi:hypothetical protein
MPDFASQNLDGLALSSSRSAVADRAPLHTGPPHPAGVGPSSSRLLPLFYVSAFFLLALGTATIIGHGRIFWEDELLGWLMLRDPSWRHMVVGWLHGVDGGGFLFYLTGRFWFWLFGHSVLSFRLYSASCFAGAFTFFWLAGRRFYRDAIIAVAIAIVWFGSPIPLQMISQGRFYGLVMAADGAAVFLYCYLAGKTRIPARYYVFTFVAHACLVTSHILGVFYSGLIILAMVSIDALGNTLRPRLYLAALLPDLLLIPSLPAIRASAQVGSPHFWSTQPGVIQFLDSYFGFSLKLAVLELAALLLLCVLARRSHTRFLSSSPERLPIYVYTASIFLLPVLFLLLGFFGPALCVPRYLLPVGAGAAFVIAEILTRLRTTLPGGLRLTSRAEVSIFTSVVVAALAYSAFYVSRYNDGLQSDYTGALTAQLPSGVPIVCEDAFAFTELISKQHDSGVKYTFLLDWPNAIAPGAPRVEVTQYHLMQNWQVHGYFSGSIRSREDFLRENGSFYTLSFVDYIHPNPLTRATRMERYPSIGNPLHLRLAKSPNYKVTLHNVIPLGELTAYVWQICDLKRGPCR